MPSVEPNSPRPRDLLALHFQAVRDQSLELCASLAPEDMVVQSMPDVSPTKWHLAHVTWFFEQFVLRPYAPDYRVFDERFHYIFNSYYFTAGEMHARPRRGLLSRPTFAHVVEYRQSVDAAIGELIKQTDEHDALFRIELGLNHERQHQELLLTDIKHVLAQNPLQPAMRGDLAVPPQASVREYSFTEHGGGIVQLGANGEGFHFDNETPRHDVLLQAHALGDRLVTNGEYLEFVNAGGYQQCDLWLSDGWATLQQEGWQHPLYWSDDLTHEFTLGGVRDLDRSAPVAHVSYFEADAYARWRGARLPTEAEWECSARDWQVEGNFLETDYWQPAQSTGGQFFGDVWEWTASAYSPYPGFKPLEGSLGEYNGKFMCSQMTVRGGSCVSATDHLRATYRSFFYPGARWQYLGIRLARDL